MQCRGRGQGTACTAPSFYGELLDAQLGTLLRGFSACQRTREQLVRARRSHGRRDRDVAAERAALERRLARYQALFLEEDIDLGTYQRQKATIAEELATLPQDDGGGEDAAVRLAAFLSDLSEAWAVATPTERNKLARELFDEVLIDRRTAVAVRPRPELRPFFALVELPRVQADDAPDPDGSDGSDSGGKGGLMTQPRDRRGSFKQKPVSARRRPRRVGTTASPGWWFRPVPRPAAPPPPPEPRGPRSPGSVGRVRLPASDD